MKKRVLVLVFCLVIISIFIPGCKMKKVVKLEIISYDITTQKGKVLKTINVRANDEIDLEKYYANKIKILEVNDKDVKFLWTKRIYGKGPEYKSTTIDEEEIIEYNKNFSLNNFSPLAAQPRYYYSIKFKK